MGGPHFIFIWLASENFPFLTEPWVFIVCHVRSDPGTHVAWDTDLWSSTQLLLGSEIVKVITLSDTQAESVTYTHSVRLKVINIAHSLAHLHRLNVITPIIQTGWKWTSLICIGWKWISLLIHTEAESEHHLFALAESEYPRSYTQRLKVNTLTSLHILNVVTITHSHRLKVNTPAHSHRLKVITLTHSHRLKVITLTHSHRLKVNTPAHLHRLKMNTLVHPIDPQSFTNLLKHDVPGNVTDVKNVTDYLPNKQINFVV